jgi:holo-[acyl-carrier protein] synthase
VILIVGLGTDIVEIVRIGEMIDRHGEAFLNRIYTQEEIRYCQKRKHCNEAFAGRWAAKEAVMKALGTGFIRGIGWQDIEILAEKSGKPFVNIQGGAGEHAKKIGVERILITISHCRAYATATAIGVGSKSNDDMPF